MGSRYLVVDYNNGTQVEPRVALEADDRNYADKEFEKLSKTNIDTTVILFDAKEDIVTRVAIQSEPILLVKAVELARKRTDKPLNWLWDKAMKGAEWADEKVKKGTASFVFGKIVAAVSGGAVPGAGAAVMGHIIAPYYAMKGDGEKLAGAAAGMYGGLSGAVIGTVIGGPIGALIGGIIGGVGLGTGATAIVRAASHPNQCKECEGAGFRGNYYRCPDCNGYGYNRRT